MELVDVLKNSYNLLRDRPKIFLPKIAENLVFSVLWLYLANLLVDPLNTTLAEVIPLVLVWGAMTPVHVWVFNSYIMMVKLMDDGEFRLGKAFRQGFSRIPGTLGSMAITIGIAIAAAVPGLIVLYQGFTQDSMTLMYMGIGWIVATAFTAFILSYLAPTSVILGSNSFKENLKDGFKASNQLKGIIAVLTVITFGLLFLTILLEGVLSHIGLAGYFIFRVCHAIINVYVLIINPSLLISAQKADIEGVNVSMEDL